MSSVGFDDVLALLALPISSFVQKSYLVLLGRVPETQEVRAQISALRTGLGRIRLLTDICSSTEFKTRERQLLLEGSDQAFVEREYQTYLNRAVDPTGLAHYTKLLQAGKTRDRVHRDIALSKEARWAGTFWFELNRLIADERKSKGRFSRWLGGRRRMERRRNLELEILHDQSALKQGWQPDVERLVTELRAGAQMTRVARSLATGPVALSGVDQSAMPSGQRRVLARLRHFSGGASLMDGTA